jgi:hypothetical protein
MTHAIITAIAITVLFTTLPGCTPDAAATVAGAPPAAPRGAPDVSMDMQNTLCCVVEGGWVGGTYVEPVCVQPRMQQRSCDPGIDQIECEHVSRLANVGPLWECRS